MQIARDRRAEPRRGARVPGRAGLPPFTAGEASLACPWLTTAELRGILNSLTGKDLLTPQPGRPRRYAPAAPTILGLLAAGLCDRAICSPR